MGYPFGVTVNHGYLEPSNSIELEMASSGYTHLWIHPRDTPNRSATSVMVSPPPFLAL